MEARFNEELHSALENKGGNCGALNEERYQQLLQKTRESKSKTSGKKPEDYQRLKRYDIFTHGECEKLICPVNDASSSSSSIRFYVHTGEIFDIIHRTHLATGHGGRTKILKHVQNVYKNITQEQVTLYLRLCEPCRRKSSKTKKERAPQVRPPPLSEETDLGRCQVDLVDMRGRADSGYEHVLVYQDLRTMFVQLRPLTSKRTRDVALALVDVFTVLGAPSVLQSDHGREFCDRVLGDLNAVWSDLKMVHGEPTRRGRERAATRRVRDALLTWTEANPSSRWSEVGVKFVQFEMNTTRDEGAECSPYEAMFGVTAKVGLATSSLPAHAVDDLKTEEQLRALIDATTDCCDGDSASEDRTEQNEDTTTTTTTSYSASSEGTASNDAVCNNIRTKREGDKSALQSRANKILKK